MTGEYAVARDGVGSNNVAQACPGDLTDGPSASGVRIRDLTAQIRMSSDFDSLFSDTPKTVSFSDFRVRDDIDFRRSCVDVLFVNIIGISVDCADWLPNDNPPEIQERFAWIWFVRPDLASEILPLASGDFAELVACYAENRMDEWWSRITSP